MSPDVVVERRHKHVRRVAPQAEQRQAAVGQAVDRVEPAVLGHMCARQDHDYPNSLATFSKPVTSAGGM